MRSSYHLTALVVAWPMGLLTTAAGPTPMPVAVPTSFTAEPTSAPTVVAEIVEYTAAPSLAEATADGSEDDQFTAIMTGTCVVLVIVAAFYTAFRCMMDELTQEDMMQERDYMLQRVERARASGRQIDGLESAKRFMASIPVKPYRDTKSFAAAEASRREAAVKAQEKDAAVAAAATANATTTTGGRESPDGVADLAGVDDGAPTPPCLAGGGSTLPPPVLLPPMPAFASVAPPAEAAKAVGATVTTELSETAAAASFITPTATPRRRDHRLSTAAESNVPATPSMPHASAATNPNAASGEGLRNPRTPAHTPGRPPRCSSSRPPRVRSEALTRALTGPASPAARLRDMEQQERLNNNNNNSGNSSDRAARLTSTEAATAEEAVGQRSTQNSSSSSASSSNVAIDLEAGMNAAVVPEKDAVASKQSSEEEEQKATTEKVAEEEEYVERIDGEEEVCSICIMEFEDDDDCKELSCGHCYHAECLDRWLRLSKLCPLCKRVAEACDGEEVTGQAIYSTATYAPPARTNLSQLAPLSSAATSQPGSNTGSADGDHNEDEDEEGGGEGEDEDDESEDGESSEGGDDEDGDDEEEKDGETGGPNATTINDDDDDQNDPGVSGHPDSDNDGDSVDPGIGFHRRQVRRANSVAVAATYANSGTDHGRGRGENGSLHHNGGTVLQQEGVPLPYIPPTPSGSAMSDLISPRTMVSPSAGDPLSPNTFSPTSPPNAIPEHRPVATSAAAMIDNTALEYTAVGNVRCLEGSTTTVHQQHAPEKLRQESPDSVNSLSSLSSGTSSGSTIGAWSVASAGSGNGGGANTPRNHENKPLLVGRHLNLDGDLEGDFILEELREDDSSASDFELPPEPSQPFVTTQVELSSGEAVQGGVVKKSKSKRILARKQRPASAPLPLTSSDLLPREEEDFEYPGRCNEGREEVGDDGEGDYSSDCSNGGADFPRPQGVSAPDLQESESASEPTSTRMPHFVPIASVPNNVSSSSGSGDVRDDCGNDTVLEVSHMNETIIAEEESYAIDLDDSLAEVDRPFNRSPSNPPLSQRLNQSSYPTATDNHRRVPNQRAPSNLRAATRISSATGVSTNGGTTGAAPLRRGSGGNGAAAGAAFRQRREAAQGRKRASTADDVVTRGGGVSDRSSSASGAGVSRLAALSSSQDGRPSFDRLPPRPTHPPLTSALRRPMHGSLATATSAAAANVASGPAPRSNALGRSGSRLSRPPGPRRSRSSDSALGDGRTRDPNYRAVTHPEFRRRPSESGIVSGSNQGGMVSRSRSRSNTRNSNDPALGSGAPRAPPVPSRARSHSGGSATSNGSAGRRSYDNGSNNSGNINNSSNPRPSRARAPLHSNSRGHDSTKQATVANGSSAAAATNNPNKDGPHHSRPSASNSDTSSDANGPAPTVVAAASAQEAAAAIPRRGTSLDNVAS